MKLLYTLLLVLIFVTGYTQAETEPNNLFGQATSYVANSVVNGAVGTGADDFDYFVTVLPTDGTMKIYIQGTNTSASAGYLFMYGYDRLKANGQIFGNYIKSSNTSAGTTVFDTLTIKGRAADTFYVRLQSTQSFSYSFSYEMVDTSENDVEPNNLFTESRSINLLEEKKGHVGYLKNGTDDAVDYYSTILPFDGTMKI